MNDSPASKLDKVRWLNFNGIIKGILHELESFLFDVCLLWHI